VIHPAEVLAVARKNSLDVVDERSVRALGRIAGADAVLVAELTEYNEYPPPRIGFAAQLFFVRGAASDARSIVDLSSTGRTRPVARLDLKDMVAVEKVYDGAQREIRDMADVYARGHKEANPGIEGADRVLRLPDLYFRFVSNRMVRDIFAAYQERQLAAKDGEDPTRG
jgi:hypothetical protein